MSLLSDYHFVEQPMSIGGHNVPSICNDFNVDHPSVVDRFFTRYYYRRPKPTAGPDAIDNEDHLVLFHSNRICLIGLAPSHVAVRKGVRSVDYNIGNLDRSKNLCSGKGKKGAMNLQVSDPLLLEHSLIQKYRPIRRKTQRSRCSLATTAANTKSTAASTPS